MTKSNGQGGAYPRRTDLQRVQVAPPTGGTYGQATQQRQATQAVPVGIPKLPPFDRPTEHPDEHVMAGVSQGPGPGPEALAAIPGGMNNQTPAQADLERIRQVLPAFEAIADLPDASPELRTWVRMMRGQVRSR